ncbi:MAG: GH25 family lysozyme, partial [Clostridia bacterium]|nr:GH25 family lysozyme [Clostridia bacterium]
MKRRVMSIFLSLAVCFSALAFPASGVTARMQPSGAVSYHGIDISRWNPVTNWTAVKKSVNFMMIQATNTLSVDPKLSSNASGAQKVGIPKGFYIFFAPSNSNATIIKEADLFYDSIKGYTQQLYPMLDIETVHLVENKNAYATKARMVYCVKLFLSEFKRVSGRDCTIYASPWFVSAYLDSSFSHYRYWVANYTSASAPLQTTVWTKYDAWQYSSSGSVPGISGSVDLDRATGSVFIPTVKSTPGVYTVSKMPYAWNATAKAAIVMRGSGNQSSTYKIVKGAKLCVLNAVTINGTRLYEAVAEIGTKYVHGYIPVNSGTVSFRYQSG